MSVMRRILIALALVFAFATPTICAEYVGNFATGATVVCEVNTFDNTGQASTLTTGTVSVYKDTGTTETTTGVTLSTDFDSRTGLHVIAIDTSSDGTFYAAGHEFFAVITAGTVLGAEVKPAVVCSFSLQNRYLAADVTKWNGTAVATPDTAGFPKVTVKDGTGTGEIDTASGKVDINDKTGFSLAATGSDALTPSATVVSDAGNSTTQAKISSVTYNSGTVSDGTDNYWKDALVLFTGASCNVLGQIAKVTTFTQSTRVLVWTPVKTAIPNTSCTILLVNR